MFLTRSVNAAITTSHELAQLYLRGQNTFAGMPVSADTAMRVSAVYAAVRVLAESVAQLPLITYRRLPRGKERETSHPIYKLLHDRPNRWQTSFEFREMMTGHVVLRGNAYAQKARARGVVRELIPLNPDAVTVTQNSDTTLAYEYADGKGGRTFQQKDILHIRGLSSNGCVGMSPIACHREAIGLAAAAEKLGAQLFGNGAKPNAAFKHPKALKDDAFERLKSQLNSAFNGDNAMSTMILEDGMDWVKLGIDPKDAQFIETRKFQIEEIARIFRVPPHKIGDLSRSTNNNIEHQSLEFVTDTLMPWLVRWEQAIYRDLIEETGNDDIFAEFLVDGLLRGDSKSRAEFYASGITNGWLNRNEVRAKENLNPADGLDEFLAPLNMRGQNEAEENPKP